MMNKTRILTLGVLALCIGCVRAGLGQEPVLDRPLVEIAIEPVQSPTGVGTRGTFSVVVLPHESFEDVRLSVSFAGGMQAEPPSGFESAAPVTPFISGLEASSHFFRRLGSLASERPDTFLIDFRVVRPGLAYVVASVQSPAAADQPTLAENGLLYALVAQDSVYFSSQSILDLRVQAMRDSLTRAGAQDSVIQKLIQALKRGGARVEKQITRPDTADARGGTGEFESGDGSWAGPLAVTAQGTVRFTDVNGAVFPVRFVTVQIWDEEAGPVDQLVTTTTTDANGNYSAVFDDNDGDGTGRDIYVVVVAQGATVEVEDVSAPGSLWSMDSQPAIIDVVDGSALTINLTASNDLAQPNNVAFEAYESINYLSRYLLTLGEPLPALVAVAYPGGGDGSFYNGGAQRGVDPIWWTPH